MKDSSAKWWFTGIASSLLVVHGVTRWFRVDAISIALLAIASLPFMRQYLDSLKIGDVEFNFGSLKLNGTEQTLLFLENIIVKTDKPVTFYPKREDESRLGEPFRNLVQELIHKDRSPLIEKVREWLKSDNDQLLWFASEIIGYFQIQELKNDLQPFFQQINNSPDQDWSDGKLNGLWAYSRLNDDQNKYQEVHELLLTTTNATTQKWLLEVYPQMVTAHPAENQRDRFMSQVNKFLQREIQDDVKDEAEKVVEQLKS